MNPATPRTTAHQGAIPVVDWDQLFVEQLAVVYNYFHRHVASCADVEHLTAATFARVWSTRHRYRHDPAGFQAHLMASAHLTAAQSAALRVDRSGDPDEQPAVEFAAKLRGCLAAEEEAANVRRRQFRSWGLIAVLVILGVAWAASMPATPPPQGFVQLLEQPPARFYNPFDTTLESYPPSVRSAVLEAEGEWLEEDWDRGTPAPSPTARARQHTSPLATDANLAATRPASAPQLFASGGVPRSTSSARSLPLPARARDVRIGGSRLSVSLLTPSLDATRGKYSVHINRGLPSAAALTELCAGRLDIAVTSRRVQAEQRQLCASAGVELIDLPVAHVAVVLLLNHDNTWADPLSVQRVLEILDDAGGSWEDVDRNWPSAPLSVHVLRESWGLGDFFDDLASSAEPRLVTAAFARHFDVDDLLAAVLADRHAIGLLPFGTFAQEQNRLLARAKVARIPAAIATRPSRGAILAGSYSLALPLFLNVTDRGARDPNVRGLIEEVLERGPVAAERPLFVPLESQDYRQALKRVRSVARGVPVQPYATATPLVTP